MHNVAALPTEPIETDTVGESEEEAWVQAARGDPTAFAPLYHRYRERVFAYVRTRTSTIDDAMDLTQQIFLRALDALPQYRGQRDIFAAWLFRIARNAVTDYYRRRRVTITWDLVPAALLPLAEGDPESDALRRESLDRLRAALAALDPETRELLALRFGARLTVGEIAAVVGKGEAATRKKLARTLHTLADHLGGA